MSAAPTPSAPPEPDPLDSWERALLDRQLEALGRLADMGMDIAGAVARRATEQEPASDAALRHAPMDFARVSRAVRMTFALQSRLIAEFKGGAARAAAANDDDDGPVEVYWREDVVDRDEVRKRQVKNIVGRLAEAAELEGEAMERLVREASERLEDERFYHNLVKRPMGEMVALICKDLGLEPDWDCLSDEYWAQGEMRNSTLGSPYAGWKERQGNIARAPPHSGGAVTK